jgi:hypothetical protein
MKANLRKLIGSAVLGLAMFSNSVPAWAGQKLSREVEVGADFARGSMVTARFSPDGTQRIGCFFEANANPVGAGSCSAVDKTGKSFSCYVGGDARWTTVVKAINDSSVIHFAANSNGGSCHTLIIENHSSYLK